MALTNYGILTCKGTAETVANVGFVVTFDVTQGAVLDALKAGCLVVLVASGSSGGGTATTFNTVIELFDSPETSYCTFGLGDNSTEINLDHPDELLTYTIETP